MEFHQRARPYRDGGSCVSNDATLREGRRNLDLARGSVFDGHPPLLNTHHMGRIGIEAGAARTEPGPGTIQTGCHLLGASVVIDRLHLEFLGGAYRQGSRLRRDREAQQPGAFVGLHVVVAPGDHDDVVVGAHRDRAHDSLIHP